METMGITLGRKVSCIEALTGEDGRENKVSNGTISRACRRNESPTSKSYKI